MMTISIAGAIVITILCYLLARGIEWGIMQKKNEGVVDVIFMDGDGSPWKLAQVKPLGGEFEYDHGDRTARRYILTEKAKIPGRRNLFLVNPRTGRCYYPPSRKEESFGSDELMRLGVADPALYHMATAQRTAAPALAADVEDPYKWDWIKPTVISIACVLGLLLVVIVIGMFRKTGGG